MVGRVRVFRTWERRSSGVGRVSTVFTGEVKSVPELDTLRILLINAPSRLFY